MEGAQSAHPLLYHPLHVGAFYLPAFLEEMLREVEEPNDLTQC